MIRIIVLDDNEPSPGLLNEWGWSVYIEYDGLRMLFDADSDPRVLEHNSYRLGVDLSRLDLAFLSHRHGDHSGGFSYVSRVRPGLKTYVTPDAVEVLKNFDLNIIPVYEASLIAENVWSTGPLDAGSLLEHGMAIRDHEHGVIVFVGCSHPGVDRIALKAREVAGDKVYMVIGGFHNPNREVLDNLAEISEYICPTHCSGWRAKKYIKRKYREKYCKARTGSVIELREKTVTIRY